MAGTISSKAFVTKGKICKWDLPSAYEANALSGIQDGKYVLKKKKEN